MSAPDYEPRVVILHEKNRLPELWLMYVDEQGTFKPLGNTGPVAFPNGWIVAYAGGITLARIEREKADDGVTLHYERKPDFIRLENAGRLVLRVKFPDGAVEYGEGVTPDEATAFFWKQLGGFIASQVAAGVEGPKHG